MKSLRHNAVANASNFLLPVALVCPNFSCRRSSKLFHPHLVSLRVKHCETSPLICNEHLPRVENLSACCHRFRHSAFGQAYKQKAAQLREFAVQMKACPCTQKKRSNLEPRRQTFLAASACSELAGNETIVRRNVNWRGSDFRRPEDLGWCQRSLMLCDAEPYFLLLAVVRDVDLSLEQSCFAYQIGMLSADNSIFTCIIYLLHSSIIFPYFFPYWANYPWPWQEGPAAALKAGERRAAFLLELQKPLVARTGQLSNPDFVGQWPSTCDDMWYVVRWCKMLHVWSVWS